MLIALETSSRSPSVAVRLGTKSVKRTLSSRTSHASDLLPALDELLQELGADPLELTGVLVGTGPGSYTGLRVGIATALGLARGAGAELRGVPSGEVLAYGELEKGAACIHLLDARQGELYFARYERREDEVVALDEPCVIRPSELADRLLPELPILGDPTVAVAAGLDSQAIARLRTDAVPCASVLLELGASRLERLGAEDPTSIEPLYLRPFVARVRKR